MGLFNKEENWWLRLTIVLIVLIWLSSISVMNREVITERQKLTDSVNYLKLQNDSLRNDVDSLYGESFQKGVFLATEEQVTDSLDKKHHGYAKERERVYNSNEFEH